MTDFFFKAPRFGIPRVTDTDRAMQALEDLQARAAAVGNAEMVARVAEVVGDPAARGLLESVFSNSPFLTGCALSDVPFVLDLLAQGPDTTYGRIINHLKDNVSRELDRDRLMEELRIARRKVALLVAVADVTGYWNLERVTHSLSDFFDVALSATISHLMLQAAESGDLVLSDENFPEDGCGYFILAMGKLGARELNYSSDIDLIVIYEPMKVDYRGNKSVQQTFIRMTQSLVAILQDRTANGYVCRVDLRLRPDPGSTPVAMPYAAAQNYYATRGENWERAAMIKARPAAGDLALGGQFLSELEAFVWRDHLDFWTLREIQAIKGQINAQRGGGEIGFLGHNVKLGRGGIREIEFYAQTQQLIFAGQDSYLRCQRTVDALTTLAESGCIDDRAADELTEAYEFLRCLEHRLQMVDDQQTQTLPSDEETMDRIAGFMAFDDLDSFRDTLLDHLRRVETHYGELFEQTSEPTEADSLSFSSEEPDAHTAGLLERLGFSDDADTYRRLRHWCEGDFAATSEGRSRKLFDELIPRIVETVAKTPHPDDGLARFEEFLVNLQSGVRCFASLLANPELLELLIEIVTHAPSVAQMLSREPDRLQGALRTGFFGLLPDERLLIADLRETLNQVSDFEEMRQRAMAWSNDHIFQVCTNALRHLIDAAEAGRTLSGIADAVIKGLYDRLVREPGQESAPQSAGVAVVALGALGRRELTPQAPLDLLFVVDDASAELDASALVQQLTSVLNEASEAGRLYKINGTGSLWNSNGSPILSLAEIRKGVLERQDPRLMASLCQTRVIAGPPSLNDQIVDAIHEILTASHDAGPFVAGISETRREAFAATGAGPWCIRERNGGLDDLEALIRCVQLRNAHKTPAVLEVSPAVALATLARQGVLAEDVARQLIDAHHMMRQLENMIVVTVGGAFDAASAPDGVKLALARAAGVTNFDELEPLLEQAAGRVWSAAEKLLEPPPG